MRDLKVDLDDISMVMETEDDYEWINLLDTKTGSVVTISSHVMSAYEEGEEGDLSEYDDEEVELAKSIFDDQTGRYQEIPRKPTYESYDLMAEFAEMVKDRHLREKLNIALDGKGAFRRFKNVLSGYPEEQEKWFAFKDRKMREEATEWLNSIDIEPM